MSSSSHTLYILEHNKYCQTNLQNSLPNLCLLLLMPVATAIDHTLSRSLPYSRGAIPLAWHVPPTSAVFFKHLNLPEPLLPSGCFPVKVFFKIFGPRLVLPPSRSLSHPLCKGCITGNGSHASLPSLCSPFLLNTENPRLCFHPFTEAFWAGALTPFENCPCNPQLSSFSFCQRQLAQLAASSS